MVWQSMVPYTVTSINESHIYTSAESSGFFSLFTSGPDSLVGWYRYEPKGRDSALVILFLHENNVTLPDQGTRKNWIGGAKLMLPATKSDKYIRFSVAIQYVHDGNLQYLLIALSTGNRKKVVKGSTTYFDDHQLIYKRRK